MNLDDRMRTESPPAAVALDASQRSIHQHSKTFSLATSFLPRRQRRAIRSLYAFCRATDDLVDSGEATVEDVEAWREQIDLPPHLQRTPILQAWVETRQEFGIDRRFEQELIDGVALDLSGARYRTWNDLERYCYLVAATVGLMSIPVLGLAEGVTFEQAAPFAIRLGEALQLTNILRDVGEDAARGRVYLPESDLHRFGLAPADILAGVCDDRFRRLMQFEIARARRLYCQAIPGLTFLAPSGRFAAGAAAFLYRAILREIEELDYDVQRYRAHTSTSRKLSMLPGILWTIARLKAPDRSPESPISGGCRSDASPA
jgi:phytoene synthase